MEPVRTRWSGWLTDRSSGALTGRQIRNGALAAALGGAMLLGALPRGERVIASPERTAAPAGEGRMPLSTVSANRPEIQPATVAVIDPALAGLDPSRLGDAVAAVRSEVRRGAFPGAALVVGRGSDVVMMEGIGRTEWDGVPVDPRQTVYDLASLSKVVATTTAVMLLVEDGRIDLDAPVQRYLPEFSGGGKALVTIRQLLTHTSGLPAWADVQGLAPEAAMRKILYTPLEDQPGEDVEYSDLGFVVLFAAAERAAGEPISQLLDWRIFAPLGMASTRFLPGECATCAPTLVSRGRVWRGEVHDPIARHLGGVAGNAGLFSTATDLSRFAAMLANGGELDGVRVLRQETIRDFTRRQPGSETRALGWDTPERDGSGAAGRGISPRAFGHTGYTGTSLWVDPDRGTWTILLTNRTFEPRAPNRIQSLRRQVHDEVAGAWTAESTRIAPSAE